LRKVHFRSWDIRLPTRRTIERYHCELEHWIDEGEQPRTIETAREVRESGGEGGKARYLYSGGYGITEDEVVRW